jgi:hypothetical protein
MVLVGGACASRGSTPVASSDPGAAGSISTSTSASSPTTSTTAASPHFDTPEAAMRYLADAWNRGDLVSLKHVTDPSARQQLDDMHEVAVNLRLDHCEKNPGGDYTCFFDHDYPAHASTTVNMDSGEMSGMDMPAGGEASTGGHAVFLVGPADTPGWYMTVLESCS